MSTSTTLTGASQVIGTGQEQIRTNCITFCRLTGPNYYDLTTKENLSTVIVARDTNAWFAMCLYWPQGWPAPRIMMRTKACDSGAKALQALFTLSALVVGEVMPADLVGLTNNLSELPGGFGSFYRAGEEGQEAQMAVGGQMCGDVQTSGTGGLQAFGGLGPSGVVRQGRGALPRGTMRPRGGRGHQGGEGGQTHGGNQLRGGDNPFGFFFGGGM